VKTAINQFMGLWGLEIRRHSGEPARDSFMEQKLILGPVQDPVIFDIGANVGSTCLRYKQLFPSSKLHAFEPFPATLEQLRNRLADIDGVQVHPFGLTDVSGSRSFYANASHGTNSLLGTASGVDDVWGKGLLETQETFKLPFRTIDEFVEENGIPRIDLLKLDIQGAELMALQGATRMLQEKRIGLIYTEILVAPSYEAQPHPHQLLKLLYEHGFRLHNLYNLNSKGGQLRQMDAIFVPTA